MSDGGGDLPQPCSVARLLRRCFTRRLLRSRLLRSRFRRSRRRRRSVLHRGSSRARRHGRRRIDRRGRCVGGVIVLLRAAGQGGSDQNEYCSSSALPRDSLHYTPPSVVAVQLAAIQSPLPRRWLFSRQQQCLIISRQCVGRCHSDRASLNFKLSHGRELWPSHLPPASATSGRQITTKRRIAECLAHTRRSTSSTRLSKTPPSQKKSTASTDYSAHRSSRKSRIGDGDSSPIRSARKTMAITSCPSSRPSPPLFQNARGLSGSMMASSATS